MMRAMLGRALVLAGAVFATAYGAARPSPDTVREALDAMSPEQRTELLDATTAALDQRPRYVDELYAVARQHPRTFDRFLANAAQDLHHRELALRMAGMLVQEPESLEQVMIATLQVVQRHPQARAAVIRAMVRQRDIVADLLTDRPDALVAVMNATMPQVREKPDARRGLRTSLEQSSKSVAPVLVEDPDTLGVLMKALLDAGMDLDKVVDAAKPDR
jgi:hypothetical protein